MMRIPCGVVCIFLMLSAGKAANTSTTNTETPAVSKGTKQIDKSPLYVAASKGDLAKVKELVAKGYDVNARDDRTGDAPLLIAVVYGYKEVAEFLIAKGADVNVQRRIGTSALMMAILNDQKAIAAMLIRNGAEETIYTAAAQGDIERVIFYLKADKSLANSLAPNDGCGALHWAAYQGHLDVTRLLIENGADVNLGDRANQVTPLYWAVLKGRLPETKLLIEKGADVRVSMTRGTTALHVATSPEIAQLLIDHGAQVDARDEQGATPLYATVAYSLHYIQVTLFWQNGGTAKTMEADVPKYRGQAENISAKIAELLISRGADVNARTKSGETILELAKKNGRKDLEELLRKASAADKTPGKNV